MSLAPDYSFFITVSSDRTLKQWGEVKQQTLSHSVTRAHESKTTLFSNQNFIILMLYFRGDHQSHNNERFEVYYYFWVREDH